MPLQCRQLREKRALDKEAAAEGQRAQRRLVGSEVGHSLWVRIEQRDRLPAEGTDARGQKLPARCRLIEQRAVALVAMGDDDPGTLTPGRFTARRGTGRGP